jgi:hypothetical protein
VGKFLLVIVVFAALVYSLFWLLERRRLGKFPKPSTPRATPYRRTLGPDDDEDFLRELERRRRHAAREQQEKPQGKTPEKKPDKKPDKKPGKKQDADEQPSAEQDRSGQDQPRPE